MGDRTPDIFPLLRCPSELIELIIFYVALPSDLLHLALTCRSLCDMIIPSHLEFRNISCGPLFEHIWTYLINVPAQARMVRRLRLLAHEDLAAQPEVLFDSEERFKPHKWPYSIPSSLWLDDEAVRMVEIPYQSPDPESQASLDMRAIELWDVKKPSWLALSRVVKQMIFLEEFTWTQNYEMPDEVNSCISSALKSSCPHLRSVIGRYHENSLPWTHGTILPAGGLTLNHFSVSSLND
jgi:hypothetical protein